MKRPAIAGHMLGPALPDAAHLCHHGAGVDLWLLHGPAEAAICIRACWQHAKGAWRLGKVSSLFSGGLGLSLIIMINRIGRQKDRARLSRLTPIMQRPALPTPRSQVDGHD